MTGQALQAPCAGWLETWDRFEQTIANFKGMKHVRLRIATVTTGKYFMPRILEPFCAQYPGIEIAMEVINRDRLLERLDRNQDDLYVMGVPPDDRGSDSESLMENPLVVVAPASHPLARQRKIPFALIANACFLVRE